MGRCSFPAEQVLWENFQDLSRRAGAAVSAPVALKFEAAGGAAAATLQPTRSEGDSDQEEPLFPVLTSCNCLFGTFFSEVGSLLPPLISQTHKVERLHKLRTCRSKTEHLQLRQQPCSRPRSSLPRGAPVRPTVAPVAPLQGRVSP